MSAVVVHLAPITLDNWQDCIHLQLDPHQEGLLATNLYSLAEAYVQPECQPRALYDGDTMIGFAMYLYDLRSGAWWVPRFMVDRRHQGRGYGRAGMQAVIAELWAQPLSAPVMISLTPGNAPAQRLYESLGFTDTGRRSHGEIVLCLPAPD